MVHLSPAVPQEGNLHILSEFGQLHVTPNEIVILQVCVCSPSLRLTSNFSRRVK